MTTETTEYVKNAEVLNENLAKIEELSQRLIAALANKAPHDPGLDVPGAELFMNAANGFMTGWMAHPAKLIENQVSYWGKTLQLYVDAQHQMAQGKLSPPVQIIDTKDKRFSNELWNTHPYFNFIKQQYLLNSEALENAVAEIEGLEPKEKQRIEYFSRQIMDLMSPTNYLGTNPEALSRAVETDGESLVRGLENLVRDIEANNGELLVTLSDKDAFRVGENLGTSEGSVVFRNRMFELIQYKPLTEKVHATPLLIFPPWINKFYVMDLKDKNSLIRWIVEQGYTLFVVSWVNPDASYADVTMDTYVEEGFLTAIDEVKKITGEKQINAVGYCIAGTTLSLTLALMNKRGDKSIKSATFFTTLTDFADQGEMAVFLNDDFVDGIERETEVKGIMQSFIMSRTFSYLRANDLIYGPAIRSYMMGEAPPAFDLLYWNGDGTNLPGKMAVQYLRGLCQSNNFAGEGFQICGETVQLGDVNVPLCAIACETDHIAAWKSSYLGIQQMGGTSKEFILSESGHIAGIINPPSKMKYGHYTNSDVGLTPEDWLEGAEFHEGSWWGRWDSWLSKRSGKMIPARQPGDDGREILGPAPGTYVTSTPNV